MIPNRLQTQFDAATKAVTATYYAMVEAEISRMLPLWPPGNGEPILVFDHDGVLVGLGLDRDIGEMAVVLVPANRITFGVKKEG